jgi:hypothetical protein
MGPAVAVTVLDVVIVCKVEDLLVVVEAGLLEGPVDEVELLTELEVDETGHVPEADPTNITSV